MTSRLSKDVNNKEDETFTNVLVKGKHGDIEFIISDRRMTEDEWNQFNVDMTQIIYSKSK